MCFEPYFVSMHITLEESDNSDEVQNILRSNQI